MENITITVTKQFLNGNPYNSLSSGHVNDSLKMWLIFSTLW